MATNNTPLSVRGLTKIYPAFELRDVSFDLMPGAITGFIGRNGAGKTTTLNSLLGFIRPNGGEVRFHGLDMKTGAEEIKQKIGFVSAGMTYYTGKKLKTITDVTRSFYPEWNNQAYQKYLAQFGLDERKTPASLSNGMKIKYALALALSHGADLMLLDEPTSGLDPASREELIEIFLSLRDAGKTVLFSTHITSDLDKCADRILFLQKGRLTADLPLDEFRKAYLLAEVRGGLPEAVKALSKGECRIRDGYTALFSAADAEKTGLPCRAATLDEIMVHLDKEDSAL
ncbi:MAG: ABC transporter ATP-binding protein [Clostridia bacterium]|nr:ABC transporter ATP-binding protein [Clostridia bacterium]